MGKIEVRKLKDFPDAVFEVKVDADTPSTHMVSLNEDYYNKLTKGKITPEKLIENSFNFLLSSEPNTSILSEFNLNQIPSYFPDYEDEIISHPSGDTA